MPLYDKCCCGGAEVLVGLYNSQSMVVGATGDGVVSVFSSHPFSLAC